MNGAADGMTASTDGMNRGPRCPQPNSVESGSPNANRIARVIDASDGPNSDCPAPYCPPRLPGLATMTISGAAHRVHKPRRRA